jgi:hypothetical protein
MRKLFLIAVLLVATPSRAADPAAHYVFSSVGKVTAALPDLAVTPGLARPDANEQQVCHGGSTKQFRHTTAKQKSQAYALYGAKKKAGVCCEVDHLISLELGGADDIKNLWPEPYEPRPGAYEKDAVENYLHRQVCAGKMSLAEAQKAIVTDWLGVYLEISKKQ